MFDGREHVRVISAYRGKKRLFNNYPATEWYWRCNRMQVSKILAKLSFSSLVSLINDLGGELSHFIGFVCRRHLLSLPALSHGHTEHWLVKRRSSELTEKRSWSILHHPLVRKQWTKESEWERERRKLWRAESG